VDSARICIRTAAIFENHFRWWHHQGTIMPAIRYATCVVIDN
jgi:hypothetical protein